MILESIAVDDAKSAINIVLSKAWDEIHLMWGFRSDLNKLKERLKMMEALLVDLGERQLQRKNVELKWFDEVKKAAYMANDLLDEILYERIRRKQEIKRSFMCMSNPLGFQWRMAHKVREVKAKIDDVFDEARRYGIQPNNVGQAASNDGNSLRPLSALDPQLQQCREWPDARQFIGRESDEAELVEALCSSFSPSEDLPFVAIVGIGDFPSLRCLELKQIRSAEPLHNILNTNGNNNDSRSTLTSLIVEQIQELTNLPQGLSHRLTSLETLQIIRCYKLDCLPDDLGRLISLKTLHCPKLKTFPEIGGLCSLIELCIADCGELEEIPSGLDRCNALQKLWIGDCPNMGLKRRLEEENTRGGGEVTDHWTGEWLGRLPHLRSYAVGGNGIGLREEEQPDRFVPDITALLTLKSLRILLLYGWPKLKSLPDQLGRFTLLERLQIHNFDGIAEIPEFIGGLASLSLLVIGICSNLKSFPSRGAMLKLKQLYGLWIWGCLLLTEGCRKDDGPEWHKISHIKYIDIDSQVIQDLL